MKLTSTLSLLALAALAILLTSCATPQPPQSFHNTDNSVLLIASLDDKTSQMLRPAVTGREENDRLLTRAMSLPQHQTAVVILENYTEPRVGNQFRDRGTPWFIRLRSAGYQHIVFLQGRGVTNPEGLLTVAEYD